MRRLLRTVCAPAVLALAGACSVGPDYRAPDTPPGAQGPLVAFDAAVETPAQPPDDWWRLYDDPALDRLVREALAANADLGAAEANLSAAMAVLRAAHAAQYPATTLAAGGLRGRDATTDEILELGGHAPQTIWLFDDIAELSYEIDLFGHVRRSIEAARAGADAVAAARDTVRVSVAAETARAYAQVCALGEQLAVARHSVEVVSREAEITRNRLEAGAGSQFDVVRARVLVAQSQSAIPPLEGQRRAALFELAALLGRTPARAPAEVEACVTPPRLQGALPVGDGAALLKRRPDIRQAERQLAAATARVGVATADLYPRVSLAGLYGGVGTQLSELGTNSGLTWGIGPSVSWSFPDQAAARARIHQAQAGASAALAGFDAAVLKALRETEQSLAGYTAELAHHRALADAHEQARTAFDMAHGQYLAGALSNLDLLTSEQSLVQADAALAASDAALVQDQIAVFRALGGGWRTAPGRPE